MINELMTINEINQEIFNDWNDLQGSLLVIMSDYDSLRRNGKNQIDKSSIHSIYYSKKSKNGNNWLFLFGKAPSANRYKGMESISFLSLVYFESGSELNVYKVIPSEDGSGFRGLSLFNYKIFDEYKVSMKINESRPLELVKIFFRNNGLIMNNKVSRAEDKLDTIGTCKDGMLLGKINKESNMLEYHSFISNDSLDSSQKKASEDNLISLQRSIEKDLNTGNFDKNSYFYKADVMEGIRNR